MRVLALFALPAERSTLEIVFDIQVLARMQVYQRTRNSKPKLSQCSACGPHASVTESLHSFANVAKPSCPNRRTYKNFIETVNIISIENRENYFNL